MRRSRSNLTARPVMTSRRKRPMRLGAMARTADFLDARPGLRIWVRINQSLAVIAIVVAALSLFKALGKYEADEKKADEDRIAKAWDVIVRMAGKHANGGQVAALERL